MTTPQQQFAALRNALDRLQARIGTMEQTHRAALAAVDASLRGSARNLVAFLAVRGRATPLMRRQYEALGLQFPDAIPSHIAGAVHRARILLHSLAGAPSSHASPIYLPDHRDDQLARRADDLLGPTREGLASRIMVTLPDDATDDAQMVRHLVKAGMTVARINCAQNTRTRWKAMIANVRSASRETGLPCRILMDLAGPKLRTGHMVEGPRVVHLRPRRDMLGRTTAPAVVLLSSRASSPAKGVCTVLFLPAPWLKRLRKGERVTFKDARGKKRTFVVGRSTSVGRLAEIHETAHVRTGARLKHIDHRGRCHFARVGVLPRVEVRIPLHAGDVLQVHKDPRPGEPAHYDSLGALLRPAHVSCTLPEVFRFVRRGDPVVFDNGVIEGIVQRAGSGGIHVRIIRTAGENAALRADKGINLPGTALPALGLTAKDRKDLRFAARHADLVSLSFVRTGADVCALQDEIALLAGKKPGIIVKIETRAAVQQLPAIFLATMRTRRSGIMMARGDLAVENGWEQLADLEETLMTMCRAAEVPLCIATQVLETMTRKALPSRAEIIDAVIASHAQCVLLNKGCILLVQ
jgi:pyruvate kinase